MPPSRPKIYYITPIDNLPSIIRHGELWSDAKRLALGAPCSLIGMSSIKERRLQVLMVNCHPGTKVGQYVPFYFCPRSIMLYVLHKGNHPEINYHEGQTSIIHLQADLHAVLSWIKSQQIPWAFSDRNAGSNLANFYKSTNDLDSLDWTLIENTDFRDPRVKEGKQAEFLVWDSFPWPLVEYVGTVDATVASQVRQVLAGSAHQPNVGVEPGWYY